MSRAARDRTSELLERRRRVLGPAYRLFYERPLEIVRAEGVRLFDADGVEYLDAYNNVPCVGHAHPRVVAAIAEQAARLNTHTRYLAEPILTYSERLLATLGDPLDHVMFTCSGSEAIDLALRVARFETGHQGVVVTANAYHGVTSAAAEASPSLGPTTAPGPLVRTIAAPPLGARDARATGERMAAELRAAIADLEAAGYGFAAFVCDSIFSSDGIRPEPTGLLRPLLSEVHARGGVFIADEVQIGFARPGSAMWGFRRHGIDPDLVVLGKPMGNGMPIAAVACRAELLDRFGRETRFFSTFAGNPVCIAAAAAVLDVIEDEGLATGAEAVGAHLAAGLGEIEDRFPVLTASRGAGLFAGCTVEPPEGNGHELADRIVNDLRDQGVLIGLAGPDQDVLKIRPPLVFSAADADRLVDTLGTVAATLSA